MSQRPSFGVTRLSAADKILIGASVLLLIDSFLPWQRECVSSASPPLTVCLGTRSAWNGDGAFAGVLMGLFAALLIIGELAALSERPLPVTIPPSTLAGGFMKMHEQRAAPPASGFTG